MIYSPPPTPTTAVDDTPRRRLIGSVVLMVLCFGWSIVVSIHVAVTGRHVPSLQHPSAVRFLRGAVEEVALLALAVYVLRRQGRSLIDLGFGARSGAAPWPLPRLRDLFPAVYLAFGSDVARNFVEYGFLIVMWLFGIHVHTHAMNVGFIKVAHSDALTQTIAVIALVVNPVFEESLVRAYLMTEVLFFSRKPWLALFVSTIVQSSYHLYQGVVPAVGDFGLFFVFAFFYMRTGRIWPVILAHLILDALPMFS